MSDAKIRVLLMAVRAALFTIIYAIELTLSLDSTKALRDQDKQERRSNSVNYAGTVVDDA